MKYIKLGDLEVSRIGLGAMSMSSACGKRAAVAKTGRASHTVTR